MFKHILIFGAGKSATCLIDHMIAEAAENNWQVTVVDADLKLAQSKTGHHQHAHAVAIDVTNALERNKWVAQADIVISLLPPTLHFLVAQDCLTFGKNLLTASYTDDNIKSLAPAVAKKGLLFLCEMGLDPGIDHMSAMQLIHRIKADGGNITSFTSHCGGLVAPESDDNPWHYKISWNPRNVVMAGKSGALFREKGSTREMPYKQLFDENMITTIPALGSLAWYPNRDSLSYIPVYGLENTQAFVRTTLRHPLFCHGWKKLVGLELTNDTIWYDTNGMTLQDFFAAHFQQRDLAGEAARLQNESACFAEQMKWLGLNDQQTIINKGKCSAMDVLQFALEQKLVLGADDKDMVVMLHEIEYAVAGKKKLVSSSLVVKGDNNQITAMAKTVGLPLGIAATLILKGKIKVSGLHIPVIPAIYEPVLERLRQYEVSFVERTIAI